MRDIKGFLIDLDGVLYIGDVAIEGAAEAISLLRKLKYKVRFISNTTRKSRRSIVVRLTEMGFVINEEDIFTPAIAARTYMKNTGKQNGYLLITRDVEQDFGQAEIRTPKERVDCVVIGDASEGITYSRLNAAFRHLMDGAELIALEKDKYWMAPDGLSLSAGPFVDALEFASGKSATIIGKPSRTFFENAFRDMGLQTNQVAMIGDDISTDIGGAHKMGMKSILVKTGKYREDTLINSAIKPHWIIDSLAHLNEIL